MSADLLQNIQTLQFTDRAAAEVLLRDFIAETFGFSIAAIELRPLAVSLNSFNGFLTLDDGKRLFFKTHTEPDGILSEYYNAEQLAKAGYPVIQPLYSSTEAGKQLLIYEVIDAPSVFDLAWAIETGDDSQLDSLTFAQNAADDQLLALYQETLGPQSAEEAGKAPVHQLFFHRLTGGRLDRFYGAVHDADHLIHLPGGAVSMQSIRQSHWTINGQQYTETLGELIERAIKLMQPVQAGPSITGHGDAHNGNVFFRGTESLLYFDPAFAGRHHPLLDLTKPLFHNVFAMWMYFPEIKAAQTPVTLEIRREHLYTAYEYTLPAVRHMFLRSKIDRVLIPMLRELSKRQELRQDWRQYLKASLFCCPFLTMNLTDRAKFPPEIALLGLSMAIEMGSESKGKRSLIDSVLDEVEIALS